LQVSADRTLELGISKHYDTSIDCLFYYFIWLSEVIHSLRLWHVDVIGDFEVEHMVTFLDKNFVSVVV